MGISTVPPIAIIGGGPCGLMLARLLQTASINYVVFERDESPTSTLRSQGGTLDIHRDSGQEALRRAGLHDQFKSLARYDATTMTLMDFQGKFSASFGDDDGGDRPEIDRQQLRQLLLNSLPTERIRWGKVLDTVDQKENRETRDLTLKFRDGSSESGFRLIVGADGAWSKVRSVVTDAKPIYSGKSFIEGRISPGNSQYKFAQEIAGKGTAMAMSAKSTLAVQQLSDASYRIYMGVVAPESLTRPGGDADPNDMDKARKTMLGPGGFYDNWTQDLKRLIEASEGPWRPWPLYRLDKTLFSSNNEDAYGSGLRWKRVPGVVLLGDAAHLATPNGEGVNQAMYDALVLFDQIIAETAAAGGAYDQKADAEALERAITAYEKEMRPRALEHIQSSIDMEDMMYADDGAQRMIEAFKCAHGEN
ncbi:tetracycline resistance [Fusarium tjaetaba]|uniref:Tetracycline resistance n=1 Tax=Fusarium tjaetaba TaxID=1567544 RepID=A0A8H5RJL3_9HYPO|nr:tetracycline resistance [Fusarium tjaetaba]KAF5633111.1 tetracycline resistance [Fusarium tjaetaba]